MRVIGLVLALGLMLRRSPAAEADPRISGSKSARRIRPQPSAGSALVRNCDGVLERLALRPHRARPVSRNGGRARTGGAEGRRCAAPLARAEPVRVPAAELAGLAGFKEAADCTSRISVAAIHSPRAHRVTP